METVHSKTHGWQMFTQVFTLDKCRIFYLFSLTNQRTKENAVCWEKIRHDVKMGWNGCLNRSGLNKVNVIFQMTYSNVCIWMNSFVFWFKCHWSLFLRNPNDSTSEFIQARASRPIYDKPLRETMQNQFTDRNMPSDYIKINCILTIQDNFITMIIAAEGWISRA